VSKFQDSLLTWTGVILLNRSEILEKVEPVVENELATRGIEVVDVQYKNQRGRWVLQVFIDTPSGVDLDTCQTASEIVGRALDREDIIPSSYVLEVSSPGLDRVLKKDKDFERFKGRRIKLKTYQAINGRKNFQGTLLGLENGQIRIDLEGSVLGIPRELVVQVRLVAEI